MAVTVKKAVLWRREIENKPGELARTLEPLARAKADLGVVMAYRYPGDETRGAVEVYPVTTKKAAAAASEAGLSAAAIPALLVEGDNRPGLAHALSQALADAGINLGFFVAQVVGRRFSAVIGFEAEEDARKATALIRKAGAAGKK
ncbi:MAG: hypothetical protein K6T59_03290 [Bryobacteraceae bacterium]|nr:hypothetical protein [Bryobacteraceae bacterium]